MPQFTLPFRYEEETKSSGLTGLAGLPLYLELLHFLKISEAMRVHLDANISEETLWKPSEIVQLLVLLNFAGGEHVDDLRTLTADSGFCTLLEKINEYGMTGKQRRARRRQKKHQNAGALPSCSTVFRFLKQDGTSGLAQRRQGVTYLPEASETVRRLCACNQALVAALAHNKPSGTVTLDMDATLIETYKADALYSYKGFTRTSR